MPAHRPYADDAANAIYNLMFCDAPETFAGVELPADEAALRALAEDQSAESRLRVLAYNRLRAQGKSTPKHVLLGVITEVRLDAGLDALAAYADGRVRYINQGGATVIVEDDVAVVAEPVAALFAAAQSLVERIGPWDGERLEAPGVRRVRLTFLVSDGLYFGEGDMADLARDPLGGPVFSAAAALLAATVDFASGNDDAAPSSQ